MPPKGVDGISVVPALRGQAQVRDGHLYWEMLRSKRFAQAVRVGNFKALRPDREAPIEVYNLRADPGETRNMAAEQPALVERARTIFQTDRTESDHWPVPPLPKKSS